MDYEWFLTNSIEILIGKQGYSRNKSKPRYMNTRKRLSANN